MTLADVAAKLRADRGEGAFDDYEKGHQDGEEAALKAFGADPDFTLRERMEQLARRLVASTDFPGNYTTKEAGRVIREAMEGKS